MKITKELFLSEKKPYYIYDKLLEVSLNKKGRGFLLNWVVNALEIHYNKKISTKYLKQFVPFYTKIQELEREKEELKKYIFKCKEVKDELFYKKDLKKVNEELKVLKSKSSKKISNLIQRYSLKTNRSLYYKSVPTLTKSYKTTEIYENDIKGKPYLKDVKSFVVGEEYRQPKQEVIFQLIPQ